MTYQPIVPFGGLAGWSFLARTKERQQEAFDNSASVQRDLNYFRENIGEVKSAEGLVSDRRLLSVALGAFGLEGDINNKFFIRKVLEDGTLETGALANRLSDKRYLAMSKAFGFGDFDTPNTQLSDFPDEISQSYKEMQFEVAVGTQDESMRLAIGLDRELDGILTRDTSDNGKWYSVMGTPPVREVFEAALGLPSSFGSLDIDTQLKTFREKSEQVFGGGEVSTFEDPAKRRRLVQLYLLRTEVSNSAVANSSASAALTLLQGV